MLGIKGKVENSGNWANWKNTSNGAYALSSTTYAYSNIVPIDEHRAVLVYADTANGNKPTTRLITRNGLTVTQSGATVADSTAEAYSIWACLVGVGKVLVTYEDYIAATVYTTVGVVISVSTSGTISVGSPVDLFVSDTVCEGLGRLTDDKAVCFIRDYNDSTYPKTFVVSVSGTVPSAGSAVTMATASVSTATRTLCVTGDDQFYITERYI